MKFETNLFLNLLSEFITIILAVPSDYCESPFYMDPEIYCSSRIGFSRLSNKSISTYLNFFKNNFFNYTNFLSFLSLNSEEALEKPIEQFPIEPSECEPCECEEAKANNKYNIERLIERGIYRKIIDLDREIYALRFKIDTYRAKGKDVSGLLARLEELEKARKKLLDELKANKPYSNQTIKFLTEREKCAVSPEDFLDKNGKVRGTKLTLKDKEEIFKLARESREAKSSKGKGKDGYYIAASVSPLLTSFTESLYWWFYSLFEERPNALSLSQNILYSIELYSNPWYSRLWGFFDLIFFVTLLYLVYGYLQELAEEDGIPEYKFFIFFLLFCSLLIFKSSSIFEVFIFIELIGFTTYGFLLMRRNREAALAGMKYYLFSIIASAFMLIALFFFYLSFGTLDLYLISFLANSGSYTGRNILPNLRFSPYFPVTLRRGNYIENEIHVISWRFYRLAHQKQLVGTHHNPNIFEDLATRASMTSLNLQSFTEADSFEKQLKEDNLRDSLFFLMFRASQRAYMHSINHPIDGIDFYDNEPYGKGFCIIGSRIKSLHGDNPNLSSFFKFLINQQANGFMDFTSGFSWIYQFAADMSTFVVRLAFESITNTLSAAGSPFKKGNFGLNLTSLVSSASLFARKIYSFFLFGTWAEQAAIDNIYKQLDRKNLMGIVTGKDFFDGLHRFVQNFSEDFSTRRLYISRGYMLQKYNALNVHLLNKWENLSKLQNSFGLYGGETAGAFIPMSLKNLRLLYSTFMEYIFTYYPVTNFKSNSKLKFGTNNIFSPNEGKEFLDYKYADYYLNQPDSSLGGDTSTVFMKNRIEDFTNTHKSFNAFFNQNIEKSLLSTLESLFNNSSHTLNSNFNLNSLKFVTSLISPAFMDQSVKEYLPCLTKLSYVNFRDIFFSRKYFSQVKDFTLVQGAHVNRCQYLRSHYSFVMSIILESFDPALFIKYQVLPNNVNLRTFKDDTQRLFERELLSIDKYYNYVFRNYAVMSEEQEQHYTSIENIDKAPSVLSYTLLVTSPFSFLSNIFFTNPQNVPEVVTVTPNSVKKGDTWLTIASEWCSSNEIFNLVKNYYVQFLTVQDLFLNFGSFFLNDFYTLNTQFSFIGFPIHSFYFLKFIKNFPVIEYSFLSRFKFSVNYLLAFEKSNKLIRTRSETFFDDGGFVTPFNFGSYKEELNSLGTIKTFSNIWMNEFQNLLNYKTFNTFESTFNEASANTLVKYNETFPHYCPNNFCSCGNTLFGGVFHSKLSSFYKSFISLYKGYHVMLTAEDIKDVNKLNGDDINLYGDNHLYSTLLNLYSEYKVFPLFVKIKDFLDYREMVFDVNFRVLGFTDLKNINYFSVNKLGSFEAFLKYSFFSGNNPLEVKQFACNTFLLFSLNIFNTYSLHNFILQDINTFFLRKLICYNLNIFMGNSVMPFTINDFYVVNDFKNCSTENLRKFLRGFKFFFAKEYYYDFALKRDFYKLAALLSELRKSDLKNYELVKKIISNPESFHIHNVYSSPKLAFFGKSTFTNYAALAGNLEFDFIKRFSNESVFSEPIVWDGLRRAKHMVQFNNEVKPRIKSDILGNPDFDKYYRSRDSIGFAVGVYDDLQLQEISKAFSNDDLFFNARASYSVAPFMEFISDDFAQNFALKQRCLNTRKLFGIIPDGHFSLYKYYAADFNDVFNTILPSKISSKLWQYTFDNNCILVNEQILKKNKKLRELVDALSKLFFLVNKSDTGLFLDDFFHFIENNKIPVSSSNKVLPVMLEGNTNTFSELTISPFLLYKEGSLLSDSLTREFFAKVISFDNIKNVYSLNEITVSQTVVSFRENDSTNIQIPWFLFNSLKGFDWVNSWISNIFFNGLEKFMPTKDDLSRAYRLVKSPLSHKNLKQNKSFSTYFKETFLDSGWWSLGQKCSPSAKVGTEVDDEGDPDIFWVNTLPDHPEFSSGLGSRVFERGGLTPYGAIMGGLAFEESFQERPYRHLGSDGVLDDEDYDHIGDGFNYNEEDYEELGLFGDDYMDNFYDVEDLGPHDETDLPVKDLFPTISNREFFDENLGISTTSMVKDLYSGGSFYKLMNDPEVFISSTILNRDKTNYLLENLGIDVSTYSTNSLVFESDDDDDIESLIDDNSSYDELVGVISDDLNMDEPVIFWDDFDDYVDDLTDVSNARVLDFLFGDPAGLLPTGYFYEVLFNDSTTNPYNAAVSKPLFDFTKNIPSPIMHKFLAEKFLDNIYENKKVFSGLPVFGAILYEYAIRDSLFNNSPAQYVLDHAAGHSNFIEFRGKARLASSNIKNIPSELKHYFFDTRAQSSLNYSRDFSTNFEFLLNLKYKKKGMYSLLPNISYWISNDLFCSEFVSSYAFTYAFLFVKGVFSNVAFGPILSIYKELSGCFLILTKKPQEGFYTKYTFLSNNAYNSSLYLKYHTLNSLMCFFFSTKSNIFLSFDGCVTNDFFGFLLDGSVTYSSNIFTFDNLVLNAQAKNIDIEIDNFSSFYNFCSFLFTIFCEFLIKSYNIICLKGLLGVVNTVSYKINYLNYGLPYSKGFDILTFKFFEHPLSLSRFNNVFNYGFDGDNLGFTGSLSFCDNNSSLIDFCILTAYTDSVSSYDVNRQLFTSLGFLLIKLYESSIVNSGQENLLTGLLKYCRIDLGKISNTDLVKEFFPCSNSRVKSVKLPSTGEELFIFYKTNEPVIFDKEYEILLKLEGMPQCDINAIKDCVHYDESWFFNLIDQLFIENSGLSVISKEDYNLFVYGLIFNFGNLVNTLNDLKVEINPIKIWSKFFTEYSLSIFYKLLKSSFSSDYGSYKFLHEYFISLVKLNFGSLYKANIVDSFLNIRPNSRSILFNGFNDNFFYLFAHEIFKFVLYLSGYSKIYSPGLTIKDIVIRFDNFILDYKISPYNIIAMFDSMIYQFKRFRLSSRFFDNVNHFGPQISLKDSPMLLNCVYFIFEKVFFNYKKNFFEFTLPLNRSFTMDLAFNSIPVWGIVLCGFTTDPGSWGNVPPAPPILPKYDLDIIPNDQNYKSIYNRIKSHLPLYESNLVFTRIMPEIHNIAPLFMPYNLYYFQPLGRITSSIIRLFEFNGAILEPLSIKKASNKAYSFAFSKIFMRQVFQAMIFYNKPMHLHSRFESFLLDYKIEMLGKNSLYPVLHFKHSHFIPGLPSYNYPGYFAFFAYHFLDYTDGSALAETLVDISKKDLFGISTFLQPQLLDDEFYFHFIQDFDQWFFSGRSFDQGKYDHLAQFNRRSKVSDKVFATVRSLDGKFRASRLTSSLSNTIQRDNTPYDFTGDHEAEDPFFDALLNSFAVEEFIALESKAKGLRFLFYKYYDYFFRNKYFGNSCETSLAAGRLNNAKKKYLNILITGLNIDTQDMKKSHSSYKHTELLSFLPPKEHDSNFIVNEKFFEIYNFMFLPSMGDVSNFIVNILGVKSPYKFYADFLSLSYPAKIPLYYTITFQFFFNLSFDNFKCSRFEKFLYTVIGITVFDVKHYLAFEPIIFSRHAFNMSTISTLNFQQVSPKFPINKNSVFLKWLETGKFTDQISLYYFRREYAFQRFVAYLQSQLLDAEAKSRLKTHQLFTPQKVDGFEDTIFLPQEFFYPIVNRIRRKGPYNALTKFCLSGFVPEAFRGSRSDPMTKFLDSLTGEPLLICFRMQLMYDPVKYMETCLKLAPVLGTFYKSKKFEPIFYGFYNFMFNSFMPNISGYNDIGYEDDEDMDYFLSLLSTNKAQPRRVKKYRKSLSTTVSFSKFGVEGFWHFDPLYMSPRLLKQVLKESKLNRESLFVGFRPLFNYPNLRFSNYKNEDLVKKFEEYDYSSIFKPFIYNSITNFLLNGLVSESEKENLLNTTNAFCQNWSKRLLEVAKLPVTTFESYVDKDFNLLLQRLFRKALFIKANSKPNFVEDDESALRMLKGIVANEIMFRSRRVSLLTDFSQNYTLFLAHWLMHYRSVLDTPLFFFAYGKPYHQSHKLCYLDLMHYLPTVTYAECPGVPQDLFFYCLLELDEILRKEDARFHLYINYFEHYRKTSRPDIIKELNRKENSYFWIGHKSYFCTFFENALDLISNREKKERVIGTVYAHPDALIYADIRCAPTYIHHVVAFTEFYTSVEVLSQFELGHYLGALFLAPSLIHYNMFFFCGCKICRLTHLRELFRHCLVDIYLLGSFSTKLPGCLVYLGSNTKVCNLEITSYFSYPHLNVQLIEPGLFGKVFCVSDWSYEDAFNGYFPANFYAGISGPIANGKIPTYFTPIDFENFKINCFYHNIYFRNCLLEFDLVMLHKIINGK